MKADWRKVFFLMAAAGASSAVSAHPAAFHVEEAFVQGLLHPLTGMDHLMAMLAVGFWAACADKRLRWALPCGFVLMMMAGAALAAWQVVLPGVEAGIAVSVLLLGLLIFFSARLPAVLSLMLISLFAIAHGYAHGAEYQGQAGMLHYGAGFVLTTIALHFAGYFGGLWVRDNFHPVLRRCAGLVTAAFGMYLLVSL